MVIQDVSFVQAPRHRRACAIGPIDRAARLVRGCRCRTGSRRSATSSPFRLAGSSTGTAAASTTRPGGSGGATRHALDRVPARVPGLAPRPADAAGEVHRALLPRRGDGVRRRPSAVRALPPRRLRPARRALARAPSRPGRRRRDRRAAARRAARPATRGRRLHDVDARRSPRWRVRPAGRRAVAGARRRAPRWTPAGYTSRERRPGGSARSITPPSLVALLRTVRSPLVPFLHPSAGA